MFDYIRSGNAIYEKSFAIIQQEASVLLKRFASDEANVVVRIIHACGMVDIANDVIFTQDAVKAAKRALADGANILCDSQMVVGGIMRSPLLEKYNNNEILCTLNDPSVSEVANSINNTRSAAGVRLWGERLAKAIVVIGNAPTALFYLLEIIAKGAPKPSLIIGMPVGFVGAVESKEALIEYAIPSIVVRGRRGGSAMAVATINAILLDERD